MFVFNNTTVILDFALFYLIYGLPSLFLIILLSNVIAWMLHDIWLNFYVQLMIFFSIQIVKSNLSHIKKNKPFPLFGNLFLNVISEI